MTRPPPPARLPSACVSLWVKICGITNAADAVAAVEAGADALGFMFYEPSQRHLAPARAAEIVRELPPLVAKVGVFVNPSADFVRAAIATTGLDTLQFHGEETPEFCAQFGRPFLKAFRVKDRSVLAQCAPYRTGTWLFDSFVDGALGGTGVAFDWEVAIEAVKLHPKVILAGGLKVETVADAVRRVRPYGVDVSSGVESAPGKKDQEKIRRFIVAARGAGG